MADNNLLRQLNEEFRTAVMPVTIFVGVEIFLGFLGNLLVLYVFTFHYTNCTYKYFVIFLASIDILSCLTTMPGEVITQINWFDYQYPLVCKIKSFFNVYTVCADTFCLLTIAVDRYRNQCRPNCWQFLPKHAKQVGVLNCVAAFILALPCAILWGVEHHQQIYNHQNVTVRICEKDEKYADSIRPVVYSTSIESIVSLSLFAICTLYVIIARNTVLSTNNEETNAEEQQKLVNRHDIFNATVRRNTMTMGFLTAVFVVTTIMYFTMLSLIAKDVLQKLTNSGKAVYFFFFRFYFVNHVMNPVVYGILDPEFRTATRNIFRSICRPYRE